MNFVWKRKIIKKKEKKKGGNKCFDYWTLPAATPSTTFSLYLSLSFSLSAATPSLQLSPQLFLSLFSSFFFFFLPPPTPKSLVNSLSLSLSLSTIQPPCIRGYMSWQETFFFFSFHLSLNANGCQLTQPSEKDLSVHLLVCVLFKWPVNCL